MRTSNLPEENCRCFCPALHRLWFPGGLSLWIFVPEILTWWLLVLVSRGRRQKFFLPCRIQCRISSSTSSLCGYRTVQFVVIEVMKRQDAKIVRRDEGRKGNHDKSALDPSVVKNHQWKNRMTWKVVGPFLISGAFMSFLIFTMWFDVIRSDQVPRKRETPGLFTLALESLERELLFGYNAWREELEQRVQSRGNVEMPRGMPRVFISH